MSCQICGYFLTQNHRLLPGAWGGTYEEGNVASLCPNHHIAIHFLMRWWMKGKVKGLEQDWLSAYRKDLPLWAFWLEAVQPICDRRKLGVTRLRKLSGPPRIKAERPSSPRMTCEQLEEVAEAARSWSPPESFRCTVDVDPRKMIVYAHVSASHIGGSLIMLVHPMSSGRVHESLYDTATDLKTKARERSEAARRAVARLEKVSDEPRQAVLVCLADVEPGGDS